MAMQVQRPQVAGGGGMAPNSGPINWGAGVNKQGKPALDKASVDCLLVRLGEAQSYLKAMEARNMRA